MANYNPLLLTLMIFALQFNFSFTMATKTASKEQLECTMCTSCENPCQPLPSPPPPPEIACPPPPPPQSLPPPPPPSLPECPPPPPPAEPECPPPPEPLATPPMVEPWPKPQFSSPPNGGGGVVGGTCYPPCVDFSPPTVVLCFPYCYKNPPPSVFSSSSLRLGLEYLVFSISLFYALLCCF